MVPFRFVRLVLVPLSFLLTSGSSYAVEHDVPGSATDQYLESVRKKILSCFTPPAGWDRSKCAAQVTIECDGKIDHIVMRKHLIDHRRTLRQIDSTLVSAFNNASPLIAPPKEVGCPVKVLVEFFDVDSHKLETNCKVTLLN